MDNYLDLPQEYRDYSKSRVVVLPIPYDGTSTWLKGADQGPKALLEASTKLELYDIPTDYEPFRVGIHTASPITEMVTPDQMVAASKQRAKQLIDDGKFVVSIGGEHSVSIGVIEAHAEAYSDLTVLQIDAHTDLQDEYCGSRYNHGCVMARVKEHCPIVQVGIRSMDEQEKENVTPGHVFWAHQIVGREGWQPEVVKLLSKNVYITFDLDGFDPSVFPSTGTPEPGGLSWYPVMELMRLAFANANVVGFDVVELCPNPIAKASDFLAAKLIYRMLALKFLPMRPSLLNGPKLNLPGR